MLTIGVARRRSPAAGGRRIRLDRADRARRWSGRRTSAMPVKMANASRTFMTTPATRMTILVDQRWAANERGSSAPVAVLALELHEAADGQPVERVEGLALVAQDLGPRREADPELEDADVGQPGRDEVAELVDDHEHAEDDDEQDDRDERLDEAGHAGVSESGRWRRPRGPRRRGRRGRRRPASAAPSPPNRSTAASSSARDAGEVERAVEEPGDGDLVGGDERGRGPRPGDARPRGRCAAPGSAPRPARGSRAGRWRRGRAAAAGDGRRSG